MSKNQELNELINTISEIYKKNILYISKEHKDIYSKIIEFEAKKTEQFKLEFIDNHFEIIDSKNNRTYNCNPFFDAQERTKNIDSNNSFKLISSSPVENRVNYNNQLNAYNLVNEYIHLDSYDKNKIVFNKFIFIGTLLGVHLNDMNKVLDSKAYLIIEDNIEIFRLSLFLCDYEALSLNRKLFFCINEERNKNNIINNFLLYKYEFNNYIGFEVGNASSIHNIDLITKCFINFDPLNYPFSEYLCSLKRGYHYLKNSTNGIVKLSSIQAIIDKPILYLGSGPSLGKYFQWVCLNKDKFLIACAASVLKRFEQFDIIPDIILSADGQKEPVLKQFDVHRKYYQNSIILTSIKTDEDVIQKIDSENLFFYQDSLELISGFGIHTGVTIGDVGLSILLNLGARNIYLLGFDASISETGQTHDEIYKNSKFDLELIKDQTNEDFKTNKNLIAVKGNFKNEVLTLMLYVNMIDSINEITSNLNKKVMIFNLSDGAYFNNCKPLKINDIQIENYSIINKLKKISYIKTKLKALCIKSLSQQDIKKIKLERKILKKLDIVQQDNIHKEIAKLEISYRNSRVLQLYKKFLLLIRPYSDYTNNNLLEYNQFKKFCEILNNIYMNVK